MYFVPEKCLKFYKLCSMLIHIPKLKHQYLPYQFVIIKYNFIICKVVFSLMTFHKA